MKVLVVQSDPALRARIAACLAQGGCEVVEAENTPSLAEAIGRDGVGVMLLDLALAGNESCDVLAQIRRTRPELPIILLADGSPPERVARAASLGVLECVVGEPDLDALARRTLEVLRDRPLRPPIRERQPLWTKHMLPVYRALERAAGSDATVLLTGETGTGKEVAARTIHALSARSTGPFNAVNCAALSETLFESELFGHEKGAFTGATEKRKGRFELADRGTLLLDEVSEMDPKLQTKLLRVLQEREFERVGSSRTIRVDVRVIATTNRDLQVEVAQGRFREDLYYRLNVVPIRIPPLRERRSEIRLLLDLFLGRHGKRATEEAIRALEEYDWPGNVRELENLVECWGTHASAREVRFADLPEAIREMTGSRGSRVRDLSLAQALEVAERRHLLLVLEEAAWSQRKAAALLGISRNRLARKIVDHGIASPVARLRVAP